MDVRDLIASLREEEEDPIVEGTVVSVTVAPDDFEEGDDEDTSEEDLTNTLMLLETVTKMLDEVYTSSDTHMPTTMAWKIEEVLEEAYAFLEEFEVQEEKE